jgi:hypothetical protein
MSTIALYVSILSAAMSNPSACHDRLTLAIENAGNVVSEYTPRAKAKAMAERIVVENAECRGGMMFVRASNHGESL